MSPGRSDGGQRLYSDHDVSRLSVLGQLTAMGRSIGMVADLSDEEALELLHEDRRAAPSDAAGARAGRDGTASDRDSIVEAAFRDVTSLDSDGLDRRLWRAAMTLDSETFLDSVVAPLLRKIGDAWESGALNPGQEHLGSDVIDRVLSRLAEPSRQPDGRPMVVATLPGERHGLGARLVAAAATVEGWTVTYLGTDLPVADIASMAHGVGAEAVGISVVSREGLDETIRALASLRRLLDPSVRLLVGGRGSFEIGAERMPAGIEVVAGLEGLRALAPASA